MNRQFLFIVFLTTIYSSLFSQSATVSNIQVSGRTDGSGYVDVYYNLSGTASIYYIIMEASFNNGTTFTPIASTFLSGSIGAVAPGNNLHIIWNGKGSNDNTYSVQTKVKLIASTSEPCGQPFTDSRDGKTYNTVQIGTQCWLRENLNIGTKINGSGNQTNNSIIEKYCYSDLESNCNIYGGLYQWNEMMQYVNTAGAQGICPSGWHIPTDAQWTTVTTFLGGTSVAGGKMKTTGTIQAGTGLWNSPNTGATNESGFSSVPAGSRSSNGTFSDIGVIGSWWSSTFSFPDNAWYRFMYYYLSSLHSATGWQGYGQPVRCLRD
ncbi:MAG: hypothetical protein NT004_18430 [Bacteroidetes bacterium]|nr:hypothetical protein [Bacteroidota bacterium]